MMHVKKGEMLVGPELTPRMVRKTDLCQLKNLDVPRGESWPGTRASSRRWIVGLSPCVPTRNKQVVIVVIVISAPPTRASFGLPFGGRQFATLFAFDTSPANGASIRIAQPLLKQGTR